jgi:uncharacterized heparinase superfamily protein
LAIDALANGARNLGRLGRLLTTRAVAGFSPRRLMRLAPSMSVPAELVSVPRPILPGSGPRGAELYSGVFSFAGHRVDAGPGSIFTARAPSREWEEGLHGFGWLADLAAADNALSRAYARSLVEEWAAHVRMKRLPRQPDIAARRLINLLTYSALLLNGADTEFRRLLLRLIARHAASLRRDLRRLPAGLPRLLPAIALASAGLSLPDGSRMLKAATDALNTELRRLVLTDGGPATRNPDDLLSWAADLLPLREAFAARALEAPRELLPALDRMWPMLRFFRHPEGSLALFNGMGPTRRDLLEAVLARDDVRGKPVLNTPFSGYQRLEAVNAVIVADAGPPPSLELSSRVHAGTLSFEFSSGTDKIVMNCGSSLAEAYRHAARRTAAHSTLTVNDTSSSRFLRGWAARLTGPVLRHGPQHVEAKREDRRDGTALRMSHNGYASRFGVIHQRMLRLDAGGGRLDGLDVLKPVRSGTTEAVLRFHLHPDVRATALKDKGTVLLVPSSGDVWLFSCDGHPASIEESVYFAAPEGPRGAEQIVVRLGRTAGVRAQWTFERTGSEMGASALELG